MYIHYPFGYFGWKFWATFEGVPLFWQFCGRAKTVSPFTFWPKFPDFLGKWLAILVPMIVFPFLSRRNFGTSNRFVAKALSAELWAGHYFFGEICPLLIFLNTFHFFGLAMPANIMTSVQEFCFQTDNKTTVFIWKCCVPRALRLSCQDPPPA